MNLSYTDLEIIVAVLSVLLVCVVPGAYMMGRYDGWKAAFRAIEREVRKRVPDAGPFNK